MIKLQLSDFSYISMSRNVSSKALRFTLSVRITLSASPERPFENKFWELAWEGNMAFYTKTGLKWSPPISRFSPKTTVQLHWINPEFYNDVLEAIQRKEYLLKPLKTAMEELLAKEMEGLPETKGDFVEVEFE